MPGTVLVKQLTMSRGCLAEAQLVAGRRARTQQAVGDHAARQSTQQPGGGSGREGLDAIYGCGGRSWDPQKYRTVGKSQSNSYYDPSHDLPPLL
jgi:hypothetical protein